MKAKQLTAIVLMLVAGCGGSGSGGEGGRAQRVVIQNKGSDTLVNVAQAWAEEYKKVDAKVAIAVTGGGSGTGIASLINGTVDIANASRKMKRREIEAARKEGHQPKEHIVGHDALAVFLHHDNPISEMTIEQLHSIYAEGGKFDEWSDLGVEVPGCSSGEIVRVSRQNNSGTYAYFKEAIIGKGGEYKLGSRDMHGSKDVVDLVEKTACAIGYSGLAYATDHINMPCIKADDAAACVAPAIASASEGTYPIARPLLMYTAGEPEGEVKAYMDWILSRDGQCILEAKGYAPATDAKCG
jgi:phosphate transport system substrate-binding protein